MHKGGKHRNFMFVTNYKTSKVANPADRAFDFPAASIPSQFAPVLHFRLPSILSMGTNQFDSASSQTFSQGIGIGGRVVNQPFRLLTGSAAAFAWNRHRFQSRFNQRDFVRRGRGKLNSQRHTLAIRHHHKLCTLSAFGFSHVFAPFFAGENVPSAKHSCHFSCPAASSVPSKARQASNNASASSHICSRRQQVLADGKCLGISFHRAPLRNTHNIPSKQGRFGTGLGPPPVEASKAGKSGSTTAHCASVISTPVLYSRFAMKNTPFMTKYNPNSLQGASLNYSRYP